MNFLAVAHLVPLSGHNFSDWDPGLKPWAMICNRFAVFFFAGAFLADFLLHNQG